MDYAKFGEGDVHMLSLDDNIICYSCRLPEVIDYDLKLVSKSDALAHLDAHVRCGHRVPNKAFTILRGEIETERREISAKRSLYQLFQKIGPNEEALLDKFEGFLIEYDLTTEFAYYCHIKDTK